MGSPEPMERDDIEETLSDLTGSEAETEHEEEEGQDDMSDDEAVPSVDKEEEGAVAAPKNKFTKQEKRDKKFADTVLSLLNKVEQQIQDPKKQVGSSLAFHPFSVVSMERSSTDKHSLRCDRCRPSNRKPSKSPTMKRSPVPRSECFANKKWRPCRKVSGPK